MSPLSDPAATLTLRPTRVVRLIAITLSVAIGTFRLSGHRRLASPAALGIPRSCTGVGGAASPEVSS